MEQFQTCASRIPPHGLGLSVDVYTPDLFDLVQALNARSLPCGYLEVFKAADAALANVRRRLPDTFLEYHAEGLWMTQPRFETGYPTEHELRAAATHLRTLGSFWINHECASKQMAGYSFGTYLPPLFTDASADITAHNVSLVQERLIESGSFLLHSEPLLLLEVPPLTYFGFGDRSVAAFFRRLTAQSPCGLVLDIGHLWTIYRYSGECRGRSLPEFLADFLDQFPLDRVVEIHVAGLACHKAVREPAAFSWPSSSCILPLWIDAHEAPIPALLFDMLEQVLAHPRLLTLKGIALEVDNKSVPLIVHEYEIFLKRFGGWASHQRPAIGDVASSVVVPGDRPEMARFTDQQLSALSDRYGLYASVVSGGVEAPSQGDLPVLGAETEMLDLYRRQYLPHEILEWGGNLRDMFPNTCQDCDRLGIELSGFVRYWFQAARADQSAYDFFLLKLDRFLKFVQATVPHLAPVTMREAAELRQGYEMSNEPVAHVGMSHGNARGCEV